MSSSNAGTCLAPGGARRPGRASSGRGLLVDVWVPGVPAAQPRPRACVRAGQVRMYDPGGAREWRGQVRAALRLATTDGGSSSSAAAHGEDGTREGAAGGAVTVDLAVRIPRAKAHYKANKFSLRLSAPHHHISRPDVDNLAKAILDELGADAGGIIRDDRQIVALSVSKRYVGPGEECGARIRVWQEPNHD